MENLGETSQFQRIALQCHQTWQGENPLKLFSIGCCTCHHFLFYWRFEWENHRSKWWMSRIATLDLPSGKRLHSYGKSLLLMGKSTISTGPFSSSLFVCLPGRVLDDKSSTNHHPHEICHFLASEHPHVTHPRSKVVRPSEALGGWALRVGLVYRSTPETMG